MPQVKASSEPIADVQMDRHLKRQARKLRACLDYAKGLLPVAEQAREMESYVNAIAYSSPDADLSSLIDETEAMLRVIRERIESLVEQFGEKHAEAKTQARLGWVRSCERRERMKGCACRRG